MSLLLLQKYLSRIQNVVGVKCLLNYSHGSDAFHAHFFGQQISFSHPNPMLSSACSIQLQSQSAQSLHFTLKLLLIYSLRQDQRDIWNTDNITLHLTEYTNVMHYKNYLIKTEEINLSD